MKKYLSILFIGAFLAFGNIANAQQTSESNTDAIRRPPIEKHQKMKQDFEQRLNLTEKQKKKAKEIHQKGAEQMKPIMKQIGELRNDIKNTKASSLDENAKTEKIKKNMEQIKTLDKKAHEIRKANSEEFEKILNKKQKQELEKMKAEGRARYEKEHHVKPAFKMFPPNDRPQPIVPAQEAK